MAQRILVVHGNKDYRETLANLLRGEGYVVEEAGSSAQATAMIGTVTGESWLDLVIVGALLDKRLFTDQGGSAVFEAARERGISRIVVTASPTWQDARAALEASGGMLPRVVLAAVREALGQTSE